MSLRGERSREHNADEENEQKRRCRKKLGGDNCLYIFRDAASGLG